MKRPSSALMPELTADYDERTSIQAWRSFFGWAGGAGMAVFTYGFLLVPTEAYPVGILNRDGYETYGHDSGCRHADCHTGVGTRHAPSDWSARSAAAARSPDRGSSSAVGEVLDTLRDKSFLALFISTIAGAAASGLTAATGFSDADLLLGILF